MQNKKIKNATECFCDGILFKSKLEKQAYKLFKSYGIQAKYEGVTYVLCEEFNPEHNLVTEGKRKTKGITYKQLVNKKEKIKAITYTPDFFFHADGANYIIEMKGKETEVFNIKFKLFRKLIENFTKIRKHETYVVALLHSIESLQEFIIKEGLNEKSKMANAFNGLTRM